MDLITHTSLSPIRRGFAPGFVNYKKGALDSQLQVIKFTSCLPMVGGSLVLPPPKTCRYDIAEILLKLTLKHEKSNQRNGEAVILYCIIGSFYVSFV